MYRILLALNTVVALLFGAAFLVVPAISLQQFGMDQYATTKLVAQFFGSGLLAIGLLAWFVKDVDNTAAQKGVSLALLIGSVAGLVIALIGAFGGAVRILSWLPVVIYFIFALGYGFLAFLQPKMK